MTRLTPPSRMASKARRVAWFKGFTLATSGDPQPQQACPHRPGSMARADWQQGYAQGRDLVTATFGDQPC